jgi:hypothetical protein
MQLTTLARRVPNGKTSAGVGHPSTYRSGHPAVVTTSPNVNVLFYQTMNAIRNIATTYQNRLGALTSQFETGKIILQECKGHLVMMYDEDTKQPQWTHAAFRYCEL